MGMPINVNTIGLGLSRNYNTLVNQSASITHKLATGKRINRADDVAAISITAKADSKIRGNSEAKKNIMNIVSDLELSEVRLSSGMERMQKIRELFVKGLNGTNSLEEINMIQREINQHIQGFAEVTGGNATGLLDDIDNPVIEPLDDMLLGAYNKNVQIGANNSDVKNLNFFFTSSDSLSSNLETAAQPLDKDVKIYSCLDYWNIY